MLGAAAYMHERICQRTLHCSCTHTPLPCRQHPAALCCPALLRFLQWDALSVTHCLLMEVATTAALFVTILFWCVLLRAAPRATVHHDALTRHAQLPACTARLLAVCRSHVLLAAAVFLLLPAGPAWWA